MPNCSLRNARILITKEADPEVFAGAAASRFFAAQIFRPTNAKMNFAFSPYTALLGWTRLSSTHVSAMN